MNTILCSFPPNGFCAKSGISERNLRNTDLERLLAALEADSKEIQAFSKKKKKAISSPKKKHSISVQNPVQKEMAKWLLQFAHPLCHGIKAVKQSGEIGHSYCNTHRQIEDHIQKVRFAWKLTQKVIINHLDGVEIRFYTNRETGAILICLDLDNHGVGTLQEGVRFFNHLRNSYKLFHNLYWEVSTNGNGLHGYVIIKPYDTFDHGGKMKNEALRGFEKRLRTEAKSFGIGGIEIKATIPVCSWRNKKPVFRMGQLAKIPRDWTRFEELKNTASFNWSDLIQWTNSPPAKPSESPSFRTGEKIFLRIAGVKEKSVSPISKQWIGRISGFKKYTQFLIDDITRKTPEYLRAKGRRRITQDDLMFALALIGHLSQIKKKSGETHMPHTLIQKTWESCFESGIVSRVWDNSRWAKIRQIFSHYGLIEWKSSKYHFFAGSDKKGKACEWRFSDAAVQGLIELAKDTERDSFENTIPQFHSETITKSIYDAVRPVLIYPIDELPVWKPDKELSESIQRVVSKLVCV